MTSDPRGPAIHDIAPILATVVDCRDMAKELEPTILEVARTGNIVAIKEIFDRAYGKAPQPLTDADGEGPPVIKIIKYDGD